MNILELENVTVDDIMIKRNEMVAIDINQAAGNVIKQLDRSQHTRLPVYDRDIDNVIGVLHVRRVLRVLSDKDGFTPRQPETSCPSLILCLRARHCIHSYLIFSVKNFAMAWWWMNMASLRVL